MPHDYTPQTPKEEKKESKNAQAAGPDIPQEPDWLKQELDATPTVGVDVTEQELYVHMDTLFPEESTAAAAVKSKITTVGNFPKRPPQPTCPKCGEMKDSWEDTFDYWYCSTCVGGA
jgi:hypothetical protein